jgi:hypothetical protein
LPPVSTTPAKLVVKFADTQKTSDKKTTYLGVLKEPAIKVRMISNLLLHDHPVPKNKT